MAFLFLSFESLLKRFKIDKVSDKVCGSELSSGDRLISVEYLGYILAVDERGKLAELQIPTGVALPLSTDLLIDESDHVRAPTISRGDILAMIRKSGEHPLLEVKAER